MLQIYLTPLNVERNKWSVPYRGFCIDCKIYEEAPPRGLVFFQKKNSSKLKKIFIKKGIWPQKHRPGYTLGTLKG